MNRVSKVVVREALSRYLDNALIHRIMEDIEKESLLESKHECGMLYGEWKSRFEDSHEIVWAADSLGGFGRAGWSVCGDADNLRIVSIQTDRGNKVLLLWDDSWGDWRRAPTNYKVISRDRREILTGVFVDWHQAAVEAFGKGERDFDVFKWCGKDHSGDLYELAGRGRQKCEEV